MQTDLSLLELGDAAHPLLQELVRLRPGTYNHSITVASIAEAAAEAIGARGLLVRVGAYFHDIGKMLKPGYFVENQGHERQPPRVAGAGHEHAGDHRPHQGRRRPGPAASPARADHRLHPAAPRHDAGRVLLSPRQRAAGSQIPTAARSTKARSAIPVPSRRPRKPAVLMLADAVESASRTLVDPTPARIESLVEEMAMKRLLDGQFDEVRPDAPRAAHDRGQPGQVADRRLSRPRQVSRPAQRRDRMLDRAASCTSRSGRHGLNVHRGQHGIVSRGLPSRIDACRSHRLRHAQDRVANEQDSLSVDADRLAQH